MPLYTACLLSIILSGYRMGIKFDKDPLAIEKKQLSTEIVNVYIVYYLDAWPSNLTNTYRSINCL